MLKLSFTLWKITSTHKGLNSYNFWVVSPLSKRLNSCVVVVVFLGGEGVVVVVLVITRSITLFLSSTY